MCYSLLPLTSFNSAAAAGDTVTVIAAAAAVAVGLSKQSVTNGFQRSAVLHMHGSMQTVYCPSGSGSSSCVTPWYPAAEEEEQPGIKARTLQQGCAV
jgi:hypothetical protein